jgi:hypothetical protein
MSDTTTSLRWKIDGGGDPPFVGHTGKAPSRIEGRKIT